MTVTIQQLSSLFQQFKQACETDAAKAVQLLKQLKVHFVSLKSFLPYHLVTGGDTKEVKISDEAKQEILLVREALELAILLATKTKDLEAFERHMSQVKTYYQISAQGIEKSPRETLILGLNLLRLLAQNRIAEFHTELELVPIEQHSNQYINHPIELELNLMEGSYNKLRAARAKVPAKEYLVFMDMLMETVRNEFADCCEKAYNHLNISDVQSLLLLSGEEQTREFASQRDWTVDHGVIDFEKQKQEAKVSFEQQSKDIIHKSLMYAKEMERII